MVGFAVVQQVEVSMGMIDPWASNALTAFNVGSSAAFYLLVRSGHSERLWPADPSLTLPQNLFAVTALAWSYGITGVARGALLGLLILAILFGGMFQLRPAQIRLVSGYAFVLMCSVALWRVTWARYRYSGEVEVIHLTFTAIVLVGTAVLSSRFSRLRAKLSAQHAELTSALAANQYLASTDGLTGLLNRRAMVDALNRTRDASPAGSVPAQRPVGPGEQPAIESVIAIVDLDLFKKINDAHGHAAGDLVLRGFAAAARACLRSQDVIARWGGEEFLVLMQGVGTDEALRALERVRDALAATRWDAVAEGLAVTFSAGVTTYHDGEPYDVAVARADHALYRAKHLGRDRVECG
jgi:diguanylate cyclase (GGDEF)-like protein